MAGEDAPEEKIYPWKNRKNLKQQALAYAQQGIPVHPCNPKTKAPLVEGDRDSKGELIPGTGGFYKATCNEDQIIAWWTRWPNAWIGIPTGVLSDRFIVDLDRKPGQADGVVEWEKFVAENGGIDPVTRRCKTPSTGEHIYFRNHPGVRNVSLGKLRPGIEIKGEGGYTVVPPSPGYQWLNTEPIREAPPWLLDKIFGLRKIPEPVVRDTVVEISDERKRAYGEAALAEMIDEVEGLQPGERSNGLNKIAFRAGQLVGGGCLTMEVARSSLESAAKSWGISSRDKALGPRGTVSRALRDGLNDPKGPTDRPTADILPFLQPQAAPAPLSPMPAAPERQKASSTKFPEHLLNVPGLVGEIAEWIDDSARYPQPLLALGAALVIVGTAAGRHIAGPTRSGTHLYITALSPTGTGKDHILRQIGTILKASGMKSHLGAGGFMSMPALINHIKNEALSVCIIDEFGAYLKRINHKRASQYEIAISSTLRTLWGASFSMIMTPAWAQTPATEIQSPALSIFGASTGYEFFSALGSVDIINGILNRFLLIEGDEPEERTPLVDPWKVPETISSSLANIYGRLSTMDKLSIIPTEPKILDISDAAEKIRSDLVKDIAKRNKLNSEEAPFYVRTAEMAIRLATIVTVGQQTDCIETDTMEWGRDFAMWSTNAMAESAVQYISDSENQTITKEILRIARDNVKFEKNGWCMVPRVLVLQRLKHKYKRRDLDEVIKAMQETEELQQETVSRPEGGRPAIFLMIPKYKFPS